MTGSDAESPIAVFLTGNPDHPEVWQADPRIDAATLEQMRDHARKRIADTPSTRYLKMVIVSLEQLEAQ